MNNPAAKYGIYYGGISVATSLLLWLAKPELLFNTPLGLILGFGLPIVMMYLSIKETRDHQEGFISFGEAIKASFLTYIIGSLIAILFTFILMNYLDTSLLELQKEQAIAMTESMSSMFGANEEMMEEMREQMDDQLGTFSFGQAIMGWLGSLVFPGIIISLIISAIMKKND